MGVEHGFLGGNGGGSGIVEMFKPWREEQEEPKGKQNDSEG